jgi:DNA (cytosine-5)-methyltransferase 1
MVAYYNEFDKNAAAWLRQLIKDGLIADGDVDERSILDVQPNELTGYTQCHFFAGIGGWSLALRLARWPDDRPVWSGSAPCQSFSAAGKGAGFDDPRHLWPAWFRLIKECKPNSILGEQVEAAINHGWLDLVQDDLEGEGYAFAPVGLPAACVGAPHIRQRLWFVADTLSTGRPERRTESGDGQIAGGGTTGDLEDWEIELEQLGFHNGSGSRQGSEAAKTAGQGDTFDATGRDDSSMVIATSEQMGISGFPWLGRDTDWVYCRDNKWRPVKRGIQCVVDGLPRGMVPSGDPSTSYAQATSEARQMRLKGYGNAINPYVAAEVIKAYMSL